MLQEVNLKLIERDFINDKQLSSYHQEERKNIFGWLIEHYLNASKTDLLMNKTMSVSPEQINQYTNACKRLAKGEPIQYILGHSEFFNCKIKVNDQVLIPRPETEVLVDWLLSDSHQIQENYSIIDLGTGSGCIAIALAKNLPNPILATDISKSALSIAKENSIINDVRIDFKHLDMSRLQEINEQPEVIISNPPYVLNNEKDQLKTNVIDHEPHLALFSNNPIQFYSLIFEYVKIHSFVQRVYLELNHKTAGQVAELFESISHQSLTIRKDMRGNKRFLKWVRK